MTGPAPAGDRPVVLSVGTAPARSRGGRGWLPRVGLIGVLALVLGSFVAAVATWTVVDSVGLRPRDPLWISPPAVERVRRVGDVTPSEGVSPAADQ